MRCQQKPPRSAGTCAQLACIWEASAQKPGNVHRFQDFADTSYLDFLISAAVIAPILDQAPIRKVGEVVLDGVRATRQVVRTNTNLGILLLLAPLARVSGAHELRTGVEQVLAQLDLDDARAVFEAIRLANPGGLGQAASQDVHAEPTSPLRQIMALAADRDLIARQYANGYREVFDEGVPVLLAALANTKVLETAIIRCHLEFLARHPDSLIVRKAGLSTALEASQRAQRVLDARYPTGPDSGALLHELDAWLRSDGNRRNPGTSADLVTACLFVALRDGLVDPRAVTFAS